MSNLPRIIIDAPLFCPHCGSQHVDEARNGEKWHRRAHTTHRCQSCGKDFDVYVSGQAPEDVAKPTIELKKRPAGELVLATTDDDLTLQRRADVVLDLRAGVIVKNCFGRTSRSVSTDFADSMNYGVKGGHREITRVECVCGSTMCQCRRCLTCAAVVFGFHECSGS